MEIYYHLTSSDKIESILKNGLIPRIGDNSSIVNERKPAIYLCKKDDLPYWKILLGDKMNIIIEITNGHVMSNSFMNYLKYKEWLKFSKITPNHLKVVNMDIDTSDALENLRKSHIRMISEFCVLCAKYYTESHRYYGDKEIHDEIEHLSKYLKSVLPRLKYEDASQSAIRDFVYTDGDSGEFTLSDLYCPSHATEEQKSKRLWEMLSEYPDDDLSDSIRDVQSFIRNTFTECLHVNCGGWTD